MSEWGNPLGRELQDPRKRRPTRGTETSQYPEEEKATAIPQVAASERGTAPTGQAITDGFSTAGSLGYGLGAVNRLMDDFGIASRGQGGQGTRIVCQRWRSLKNPAVKPCPLVLGAATRPLPAMVKNGDAFVLERWGESALVGVIDGVGHGQSAFQAALEARLFVENHFDRPLDALFFGVGRACRGTQGVVMALARFDWGSEKLTFASVGNIESRVFECPQKMNFNQRRGLIGLNAPNPVVTEHRCEGFMIRRADGAGTRHLASRFTRSMRIMGTS